MHDAYFVLSILRALDQLDDLKSEVRLLGRPRTQTNVVPPPSNPSIVGSPLLAIYNPNLVSDETSYGLILADEYCVEYRPHIHADAVIGRASSACNLTASSGRATLMSFLRACTTGTTLTSMPAGEWGRDLMREVK